jgi:hypothetical protein
MIIRRRTMILQRREQRIPHREDGILPIACRIKGSLEKVYLILSNDNARFRWPRWHFIKDLRAGSSAVGVFG